MDKHALYEYHPIDPDAGELRLVTILPGDGDSTLRVSFSHATLRPVEEKESPSLAPLQATLPEGWRVTETVDGNIIFVYNVKERTSWTHPDPTFQYREEDWRPAPAVPEGQPSFEALSYSWGAAQPEEPILVVPGEAPLGIDAHSLPAGDPRRRQSTEDWSCLWVRPNLAAALRHLRRADRPRTLWVDAICIDQLNLAERGRHVARMGGVYSAAARVVVWLGEATADSGRALDTLELIGRQTEVLDSQYVPSPDAEHPGWVTNCDVDAAALGPVRALLARPWFSRLWIWQEIVLGHKDARVQCGDKTVSWYHLRRGLVILRESHLPDARLRDGLLSNPLLFLPYVTIASTRATKIREGIAALIHGTARAGCTDHRDRVYAFLGLCDRRLADRIRPNYHLLTEEVLRDFFMAYLEEYSSLALLRFCDLQSRRLDAPTWVPDLANLALRPAQQTFASGNTRAHATVGREGTGILSVLGVEACRVREVSDLEMHGTPPSMAKSWRYIKDWYLMAEEHDANDALAGQRFALKFWATLYYGWVGDRLLNADKIRAGVYDGEMKALLEQRSTPREEALAVTDIMASFYKNDRHSSFFCTATGLVGMGPLGTREGKSLQGRG